MAHQLGLLYSLAADISFSWKCLITWFLIVASQRLNTAWSSSTLCFPASWECLICAQIWAFILGPFFLNVFKSLSADFCLLLPWCLPNVRTQLKALEWRNFTMLASSWGRTVNNLHKLQTCKSAEFSNYCYCSFRFVLVSQIIVWFFDQLDVRKWPSFPNVQRLPMSHYVHNPKMFSLLS